MTFAATDASHTDTPEARTYNRIRRRLSVLDFVVGLAVLLASGWTGKLRDWAYLGAGQRYALAVFFYVGMLALLTKLLGFGLDFYSFRLEHRFRLSNQKLGGWLRDEVKSWVLSLLLATVIVELVYWAIRLFPNHWWVVAWAVFVVLSVVLAQIAPVL